MYIKTEGLVLREVNYKDADKLLTVLTREMGKITVRARGVKRKGSRLVSACQLLAYSEFELFSYKGRYSANEAQSIELFGKLRGNIELLSLGLYFADVLDAAGEEDTPTAELLSLGLNSLHMLCKGTRPPMLIKAAFELRLMMLSGYEPSAGHCAACGEEAPAEPVFNIQSGRLYCAACRDGDGVSMPLCAGALSAVRHIVGGDTAKLFSFSLGGESLGRLSALAEAFVHAQLERGFKTLDFYKSIIVDSEVHF